MTIFIVTDFGLQGPYIGQIQARLLLEAPAVQSINLISDAPRFDPRHAAYLLAAYSHIGQIADVFLCVVDPGVGSERAGLVLKADGRFYVGPDNGLLEVVASHATDSQWWQLNPPVEAISNTFHGRDWFSPVAARVAVTGEISGVSISQPPSGLKGWPDDLAEVIYVDNFGNIMSGVRAAVIESEVVINVAGVDIGHASTFSAVPEEQLFWYSNADGLLEIAANRARADQLLSMRVGDSITIELH